MGKKRILIAISSLRVGGGAERIAAELGSNLSKRGHEVILFTVQDDEIQYDHDCEYITLDRDRAPYPMGFTLNIFKAAQRIAKICKKRDIDTVISFMLMGNLGSILSKAFFRNKAEIIISIRNNPLKVEDKKSRLQKKLFYPIADQIVALSRGVENTLKREFYFENTTYIHNMQNVEKFKQLGKKEINDAHQNIFDDDFIFITIGSHGKQKGQWYLLRCFKKYLLNNKHAKLVILGDGPLREDLKVLAQKMKISEKVLFLGNVENVFPYLRRSDCFVFTSLWEGFGNVLTEALSQNLPVISTDCIAGPREILCPNLEIDEDIEYPFYGEYGILMEPFEDRMFFKTLEEEPLSKQEKMFVKTMQMVMDNKEMRKKYSNGIERVEDFKIDKIIKEWERLL